MDLWSWETLLQNRSEEIKRDLLVYLSNISVNLLVFYFTLEEKYPGAINPFLIPSTTIR